jgi:hypothetical protein
MPWTFGGFTRAWTSMPVSSSSSRRLPPARQRALFAGLLDTLGPINALVNEVIEISVDGDDVILTRYDLPEHG